MGELGEAGGERGGGSSALQVQHSKILQIVLILVVIMLVMMMMMLIAGAASQSDGDDSDGDGDDCVDDVTDCK